MHLSQNSVKDDSLSYFMIVVLPSHYCSLPEELQKLVKVGFRNNLCLVVNRLIEILDPMTLKLSANTAVDVIFFKTFFFLRAYNTLLLVKAEIQTAPLRWIANISAAWCWLPRVSAEARLTSHVQYGVHTFPQEAGPSNLFLQVKLYLTLCCLSNPDSYKAFHFTFSIVLPVTMEAFGETLCVLCSLFPHLPLHNIHTLNGVSI